MSSTALEQILKTHFFEALKESGLKSFSFSDSVRAKIAYTEGLPGAILLFREIEPEELAEIDFVASGSTYRRRGLSSALISDLAASFPRVWLELKASNRAALYFYQRNGFDLQGRRPAYYQDGSDALNMIKVNQLAM